MSRYMWAYIGKTYDAHLFLTDTGYWKVSVMHNGHLEYSELFVSIVPADEYARSTMEWID